MISHSSGPVVCDRRKRLVREHPCGGPLGRAGKTLPQRVALWLYLLLGNRQRKDG